MRPGDVTRALCREVMAGRGVVYRPGQARTACLNAYDRRAGGRQPRDVLGRPGRPFCMGNNFNRTVQVDPTGRFILVGAMGTGPAGSTDGAPEPTRPRLSAAASTMPSGCRLPQSRRASRRPQGRCPHAIRVGQGPHSSSRHATWFFARPRSRCLWAITLLSRAVAHVIDQALVLSCSTGSPACLSRGRARRVVSWVCSWVRS